MKKMNFKHTLFACYIGYITQAIVVHFMPILFIVFNETYKVSLTNLGTLVLINFVTQITVDIIAARIIDRIGFRHAAVPAHTSVCGRAGYAGNTAVFYEQYISCSGNFGDCLFNGRRTYRGCNKSGG